MTETTCPIYTEWQGIPEPCGRPITHQARNLTAYALGTKIPVCSEHATSLEQINQRLGRVKWEVTSL